ncbi:DUF1049 domain-containing protein [Streptomyces gamaensis]|uniref:DUF1049 domain-containing protein n=1 Tax=Streptomyces gamaensis TaxID=1763542 RepID=A0ABW0YXB3_9ACTN
MSASRSKGRRRGGGRMSAWAGRVRESATTGRVVLLFVLILALVFVFENTRQVRIRLIGPEVTSPLWLALGAMLVVGWLLGRYVTVRRR